MTSDSLNIGNFGMEPITPGLQAQQSALGLHWGFSHTNSHFGLGHSALWHFQSHFGSSHTASHSGLGGMQWVTHNAVLHNVTHFGQSEPEQCRIGHFI